MMKPLFIFFYLTLAWVLLPCTFLTVSVICNSVKFGFVVTMMYYILTTLRKVSDTMIYYVSDLLSGAEKDLQISIAVNSYCKAHHCILV